jgi:hypothetical protein
MQLHERCIGENQRQRTYQPDRGSQLDRAGDRVEIQSSADEGKDRACQKRQRRAQSNRPSFTWTPDLRVRPAPMDPVARKEPVGERRRDTGANNDRGQSCPVRDSALASRSL